MKHVLLLISLLFTCNVFAQFEKGGWYLSGASEAKAHRSIGSQSHPTSTSFSISSPGIGYFLTKRLLLGANADVYGDYLTRSLINNYSSTSADLQPFARYYIPINSSSDFYLFTGLGIGSLSSGSGPFFELDYRMELGLEKLLFAGITGSAQLRYTALPEGFSFTTLNFGVNTIIGGLGGSGPPNLIQKGTIVIKGALGFLNYVDQMKGDFGRSSFKVDVNPNVGYFLTNWFLLEGELGIAYTSSKSIVPDNALAQGSAQSKIHDFGPSINACYYFSSANPFRPYFLTGIGYRKRKLKGETDTRTFEHTNIVRSWRVGGGANYFLSPRVGIDGRIYIEDRKVSGPSSAFIRTATSLITNFSFKFFI